MILQYMLDQSKVVDLFFFDYSKAFDKVLQKLADLGICPLMLN